ncbi:MAG: 2Fe-2S iron-sulfur cluster binding domain-containing protein [Rhizobiaceae bacterium]
MRYNLNINGQTITAPSGETLVDAALMGKILIPHDCSTGQCETCRVRVAWGSVDDHGTAYGDTVLACQARVHGDATLTFETAPAIATVRGVIETLTPLSASVVEVTVRTKNQLAHRPGQYAKLAFDGYPAREYSFTAKMNGNTPADQLIFQIKRLKNGLVSSALGHSIKVGHKAKVTGPYGSAFLQTQETGPLVLTASGTGFAPIWSLARAATLANDNRPLTIITGVNNPKEIYMLEAFRWLHEHGQKNIHVVAREGARDTILSGTADHYLPTLTAQTSVHVAGNPDLVERVKQRALMAQARCHADPFTPSQISMSWHQKIRPISQLSSFFTSTFS